LSGSSRALAQALNLRNRRIFRRISTKPSRMSWLRFICRPGCGAASHLLGKAMLLHEETYRPAGKPRKARLARHYYDLWCLIKRGWRTTPPTTLVSSIVWPHIAPFSSVNSWMDYSTVCPGSLRLVPPKDQTAEWRRVYQGMRTKMLFRHCAGLRKNLTGCRRGAFQSYSPSMMAT